eukprot:TRINITY_DN21563_c0_g1_i1.p1 TRINITY_DN21563_c0_g1~~TRINITY_DN21563_c0_g1_i1.p1  ORF type:complete len:192 (+),score=10.13 TRINITY_DN21563_c0_g1_i1:46-621(+)
MRQLTRLSKLSKLMFSNRANIQGFYIVKELGVVSGSCCECGGGYSDMKNSVETVMGGQLTQAKKHILSSMQKAVGRTLERAELKGANAVVNLREQIATSWVRRLPFVPIWWIPPSTYFFTHVSGTAVILRQHPTRLGHRHKKRGCKPWNELKFENPSSVCNSVMGGLPNETVTTGVTRKRRAFKSKFANNM